MKTVTPSTPNGSPSCVYRTGCETPNDCREHGYCRSPKNAAAAPLVVAVRDFQAARRELPWSCTEMVDAANALSKALEQHDASASSSAGAKFFIAPYPLPSELAEVLVEYDLITSKADRGDPEWDFVMRAADYRVIREFFKSLRPGGAPTVITNPPKGWTP